jgi:glycerol-3-phosphate dehydrogenase (NAD(P)+)
VAIRVAVIGAGSWGTTVASLACVNAPTVLWARRSELAAQINAEHRNGDYLAEFTLPDQLVATHSMQEAVASADVVVMGVPSHGFRAVLEEAAPHVRPWVPIVSLSKGLERGTLLRMSEVVGQVLPGHPVAVLTGPNLAKEIMGGQPAASVVATSDDVIARELQRIFTNNHLRVYTNHDLIGCEIAGVVKNVLAIASGMADGMGYGDNTRATLVTRGLHELARLGVAIGGEPLTFAGLAGMGDLIATCSSTHSRNHMVGFRLGKGQAIATIMEEMKMVAEGVKSSPSVLELARRHGIDMPLVEAVVAVCHRNRPASEVVRRVMEREAGAEMAGLSER